ncbi:MAG: hypothetical protein JST54_12635 [Deltaproteobacteria bacterium]|nr:hypothetical protein [Deltaproteobacteria bacterium]
MEIENKAAVVETKSECPRCGVECPACERGTAGQHITPAMMRRIIIFMESVLRARKDSIEVARATSWFVTEILLAELPPERAVPPGAQPHDMELTAWRSTLTAFRSTLESDEEVKNRG